MIWISVSYLKHFNFLRYNSVGHIFFTNFIIFFTLWITAVIISCYNFIWFFIFVNQQITKRVKKFFSFFYTFDSCSCIVEKKCETLLWMQGTSTAKHNSVSIEMIGNLLMILYCLSFFSSFFCFSHSTLYIVIHFERVNFINAQSNHWFFACTYFHCLYYTMKS